MSTAEFFIGSYSMPSPWAGASGGHGDGIVAAAVDLETGRMWRRSARAEANPAFVVADRAAGRVWAVTEVESGGQLVSYAVDAGGELTARAAVATGADSPGHLTVDRPRSLAYVTNFHGERLSLIALDRDGAPAALVTTLALPAVRPGREALQSRPHCSARLHADELLVTDFGRHVVALYAIAGAGGEARLELLHALALPDGTGPRHIAYRPGSDVAYVSNELSAGVSVLRCAARRLELVEIVPSPGLGRTRALPSEIALHPRRDVVYMANRRDESISAFAPVDGRLTHRRAFDVRGRWPRHFRFTPGGELLLVANQDSDEVVSFHVTPDGDLRWTSHVLAVPTPASVWFP